MVRAVCRSDGAERGETRVTFEAATRQRRRKSMAQATSPSWADCQSIARRARRTSVYPPANNTAAAGQRRQSAYPGGITATPAGNYMRPATIMKDPRPLKDRNYQKRCRDDIAEFLEQRGYPMILQERTLTNPTTKDFQDIFKYIFAVFDGKPAAGLSAVNKKFEDEVPILLRSAGYPFAADISKSHLQAIGAQHSWPGMLGMLHWFIQAIKVRTASSA